jgi:hypothetical protein
MEERFTVRVSTLVHAAAPTSIIELSTRGEDYTMSVAEAEQLIARLQQAVSIADSNASGRAQSPGEKEKP